MVFVSSIILSSFQKASEVYLSLDGRLETYLMPCDGVFLSVVVLTPSYLSNFGS